MGEFIVKSKLPKLSEREKDIMSVLWHSEEYLTASAIAERGGISINTVQANMRSLLNKKYIEVADIVYSGTVLTRSYKPVISAEEYAAEQLQDIRENALNFSTLNFMGHFLKQEDPDTLEKLEKLIKSERKEEGE